MKKFNLSQKIKIAKFTVLKVVMNFKGNQRKTRDREIWNEMTAETTNYSKFKLGNLSYRKCMGECPSRANIK